MPPSRTTSRAVRSTSSSFAAFERPGRRGPRCCAGCWGFYGDREPFGDRFLSLRRRVPVHTVIVDTPANIQRWWEIVDAVTMEHGIVTSELVPASHAVSADHRRGGFKLASLRHST